MQTREKLPPTDLPLAGVRVVDLSERIGMVSARLLADLGAEVIHVASHGGGQVNDPNFSEAAIFHEAFNANKRLVRLRLEDRGDRAELELLIAHADLFVTDLPFSTLDDAGLLPRALSERHPALVAVSITPYGLSGPWRDWQGSEWTHLALGGALSRSGAVGREPLLPPLDTALHGAAIQAVWAGLVAYSQRLVTGHGDSVEVSALEAVVQILDPGYGMAGSASGGMPAADGPRGRSDNSFRYPFFQAKDGAVRITILSPRQWAGMFEWLGRPSAFAGEEWSNLGFRFGESDRLYPEIQALFATLTRSEIVSAAATHGVPAASVLLPSEVLSAEHFAERGVFRPCHTAVGVLSLVDGLAEIDDVRAGIRTGAPGEDMAAQSVLLEWQNNCRAAPVLGAFGAAQSARPEMPFAGLRVLDFGVIVAGGESGRLFGDLGADVIKVENTVVPDGSRQSYDGAPMNAVFAWGNRNKRSLGVDLKSAEGQRIIRQLVTEADVILSNFKPGTLDSLGLSYAKLSDLNPGLIVAESSAFGHTGPWAVNPGYGPIVRAAVGVAGLWQYHDDDTRYFDDVTIYPDHAAARVTASAVAAMLIRRRRTRRGGTLRLAQTELSLWQHSHRFAAESMTPGSVTPVGNIGSGDAPRGVFAAAGDDEWVVVDVQSDAQFHALARTIGLDIGSGEGGAFRTAADRVRERAVIESAVRDWIAARTPEQAMTELQVVGVPAAKMYRLNELLENPQLRTLGTFQVETHPLLEDPMPSEGRPACYGRLPEVTVRPAPLLGQHTREIAEQLVNMSVAEIDELIAAGVLQEDSAGLAALATAQLPGRGAR